MASDSSDENGWSDSHIQKKQRTEDTKCSAMMYIDVLDCPVCFEPLTVPIFQCDNGHLACSSCCPKLSNKCPACALPIGNNRCIAMERVLESVLLRCPNAGLGCTRKLSYWQKSTHEKECTFSLRCRNAGLGCTRKLYNWQKSTHEEECTFSQCSCPALDCHYTGSYKELYNHFNFTMHRIKFLPTSFTCGKSFIVRVKVNDIVIKREFMKRLVFVVQSFGEANDVFITVSCIAPSSPEVGEFSYHLSYTSADGNAMTYESTVERILELSFRRPEENYMSIPRRLLCGEQLEMKLCIKMLNKEQECWGDVEERSF